MGKFIDLTGKRFGRLVVVSRVESDKRGEVQWLCRCDCGNEPIATGNHLRRGYTNSCGCLSRERTVDTHRTHGGTGTRLFYVWSSMKGRCQNKNDKAYPNYGGRGIEVYGEWKDSFEAFRDWALDNGYEEGLTIDRIDNNDSYSPENCRWVTLREQNRNKRTNVNMSIGGVTKCLKEWAEVFHINYGTFKARYHSGKRGIELVKGGKI